MKRRHKPAPRRGRPPTGTAMTAAERMRRMRARRKAAGFKSVASWVAGAAAPRPPYSSYCLLEARSLSSHAVSVQEFANEPDLLAVPRNNLKRWSKRWTENDFPTWFG